MKIAYLANRFPCSVEPYVMEEITGLRARGVDVIPSSARRAGKLPPDLEIWRQETLYLQSLQGCALLRVVVVWFSRFGELRPFIRRILSGNETVLQRMKALLHTWLGIYYAVLLQGHNVQHIHVHHGYFSAWIAMVAARLLGISYSITLHGSDLLLDGMYLDIKLQRCVACVTISEYNRNYIFRHYPRIARDKVLLRRLGVEAPALEPAARDQPGCKDRFFVLAAGRLHPVKNHAFLITACATLKARGLDFVCFIAGDGPEKKRLEKQIVALGLQREVKLLGHVAHEDLEAMYALIDLIVLTSRSEGIPIVLMEAMAHGKPVLAPNITGIPELVSDGKTGFLYMPGSLIDFVSQFEHIYSALHTLGPLRRAAREQVQARFNRIVNLENFIDELLDRFRKSSYAHPVLQ